jgi:DNA-binding NtrC family response regulator
MGTLIVRLGSLPVFAIPQKRGRTRLGRAPDNDVVLTLPEVGEHHAVIDWGDGCARIVAESGEELVQNGRVVTRAELGNGNAVVVGGYRVQWVEEGNLPEKSAPASGTRPVRVLSTAHDAGVGGFRVATGPDLDRVALLEAPITIVGRASECDVSLNDPAVSGRHVSLQRVRDGLLVRDLGSRNGTFLDGRRVESAVASPGNRIAVGHSVLELLPEETAVAGESTGGLGEMVGGGRAMRRVYARIRELAASLVPVLIEGETGTGKELASRAIHALGARARGPFLPINCTAIPHETLESELFGHTRGSFTGATADREGAFERADGGTIFLDEIGQLALDVQPKLLRVVEDGEVPRLGGRTVRSDFRLLAATNNDLEHDLRAGRFRKDLYYRLAVERLVMPALRERLEDIPALVAAFLCEAGERWGIQGALDIRVSPEAIDVLSGHAWPGNVRELRNVVLRAAARVAGGVLDADTIRELEGSGRSGAEADASPSLSLAEAERATVEKALLDTNGQRRSAARRLGIAESTLYEMIKRHGLERVGRR